MPYRENRQFEACHFRNMPRVRAGGVDDCVAGDCALARVNTGDAAVLRADAFDRNAGSQVRALLPSAMRVGHREVVGLQVAVARAPQHRLDR